jgi:hypothetical protein
MLVEGARVAPRAILGDVEVLLGAIPVGHGQFEARSKFVVQAAARLTAWTVANCRADHPTWACRSQFPGKSMALNLSGNPGGSPMYKRAEDAVQSGHLQRRIPIYRRRGDVLFAWLDARGYVVKTIQVVYLPRASYFGEVLEGWMTLASWHC